MKSLSLFFAAAFTCILNTLSAQTSIEFINQSQGVITLKCSVGNYQVNTNDIYTSIHLDEGTPILKAGAPDVEQLTTAVIVDDQAEMNVQVIHATFEEFTGIHILPSKGNMLRTVDPSSIPYFNGTQYQENAFYPGDLASLGSAYVQHQFRGQSVHFNPVQYNPVTHVMRVYSDIQVEITPTDQPGVNPLPANVSATTNATFREVYKDRFINYEANGDRYDQISEIGNMLVIADAQYFSELESWIQWKKEKGIPTELVDVATINSISAISAYVENYYNTNGLTYLVLVGDENQVPVELVNNSGGQGYCDACYGYISGNDNYSEIFIGHLLVHNSTELKPIVSKILEYEKTPNTTVDWFSKAMGLGSNQGDGIGDDGEADWQHENNIKSDLLAYTYTEVFERYDGSHTADSPSGGDTADGAGSPAASTLTTVLNDGLSLINYTGHGAHNLIVTGSYTNTEINALQNNGYYPYFIIVGCCTGDYDDDDATGETFGESWIKSPSSTYLTGGIGGAFSSVYQSWAPPMEGQDEMNKIITEMASINTRHTLGSIHYHGCASMNDVYAADGTEMTDTWILMADPTIQLRTAMPTQLVATHPASAFFGVTQLTVQCNTEDAMIALTVDGEIIATGLVSGGQVILNFDPVTGPGNILVTATSFNTIPYQGTVELVPASGPYILGQANGINDGVGNNDGLADYNEDLLINADAQNIGIETASNVTGVITCSNPNVVIDVNSHDYGDITAGSTTIGLGAFEFHLNAQVADQTHIPFVITFSDSNGNTWTTTIIITIQAPAFNCAALVSIVDASGNNNGRLDSGETVQVSVPVTNSGHSMATNAIATLSENSTYVTLQNTSVNLGNVEPGATVYALFVATVDANTPASETVTFDFATNSDFNYSSACTYSKYINLDIEDWETGDLTAYDWNSSGTAPWFVTDQQSFEGVYSNQSGLISGNQQTGLTLNVTYDVAHDISFMYKTSTENGYDKLHFLVDNVEQDNWSGEIDWTQATYTVAAGTHTLKWNYTKDQIVSSGSDACWVDNIIFTPQIVSGVDEAFSVNASLSLYPNPAGDVLNVMCSEVHGEKAYITIHNMLGELVYSNATITKSGNTKTTINTSSWSSGIYVVNYRCGERVISERVVKN